jgi:hypothetical protein
MFTSKHFFSPRFSGAAALMFVVAMANPVKASDAFLTPLRTVLTVASTVPANGDVNPYGIVVVNRSVGALRSGSVFISNFNNSANL